MRIFYLPLHSQTTNVATDAEIAQLVERNLAKVEVAGPSPVFRSKAEGRIFKDSPFCFACRACRGDGLGTCDLKAPLPGAGGVCRDSRNRSRAARVRVPFSAPKQQGGPQWFSLLLWVLVCGFVPGDLKTPLSGVGGVDKQSQNHSCAARVRVPFSAPEGARKKPRKKAKSLVYQRYARLFLLFFHSC